MEEAHREGSPTTAVSRWRGTGLGVADPWLRGPAARPASDGVLAEAPRERCQWRSIEGGGDSAEGGSGVEGRKIVQPNGAKSNFTTIRVSHRGLLLLYPVHYWYRLI
jgi:hypothetical protein